MPLRSLLAGFVTAFFCIALLYLPFAYQLPEFYQVDILFIVSLLFMLVRAFDAMSRRIPLIEINLLSPFFLIFLILILCQYALGKSGISSRWVPASVYPFATRIQFVRLVSYWLWFHLFVEYVTSRRCIHAILVTIAVTAYIFSILALWRYFFKTDLTLARLFSDINFPVLNPNSNNIAAFLELILPLVVGGVCYRLFRYHDAGTEEFQLLTVARDHWLFMLCVLLFIIFSAIVGTLSKFALAAILIGFFSFIAMSSKKKGWLIICSGALLFIILSLSVYWLVGSGAKERFLSSKIEHLWTLDFRIPFWKRVLPLFFSFPVFGTGFGTFQTAFSAFQRVDIAYFSAHLLNDYLELLMETGIVGLSVWSAGMLIYFSKLKKRFTETGSYFRRFLGIGILSGLLSFLAHEFFITSLFDPAISFYVLTFLALGAVLFDEKGTAQ